ncbi:MAG: MFS transporter [Deltaproteobacteria bacterium SG8_13]|nr:MAG: MFS transporter [Deltaproteobacteria bacterium SG8_13]
MNLQPIPLAAAANWKRTLYIMFFAQTITSIGFSSIFPFLPLYVQSLGSTTGLRTELLTGLVFSAQAFTMMIASPLWGSLADRWGRKLMVERAMFGGTVILGLMAFARSAEELVVLRAIQGLITGTIGAANALVAATVPRERTGYAMGLMQVGMGLGVGIGPVLGGAIADAYGYPAAFYATAALLAAAGVIVLFGVQENFTPPVRPASRPAGVIGGWRTLLSAPGVMMVYALRFINHMGRMIFMPILPMFLLALLVSPERVNSFTGLVVGIAAAATTVFAVLLGRLGDRIGHRRILIACSFCCFGFFTLQALATGGWQLLLLQALTGMALGGIVPGISALLANYTRLGDEGAAYGLDNSVVSGARMVGPLLGVGIGMWLGLRAVFVAAALLYLVAAALASLGLPKTAAERS